MLKQEKKLLDAVPALAALAVPVYILAFGVNVPFWDEWTFADVLKAYFNGTLSAGALFSQHLEHRLFFPKAIMLASAVATSWNVKAEMLIGWLISCCGFVVLWMMLKKAGIKGRGPLALVSILFFNVGQWENMLWGWQISIYLMVASVICAFFFLSAGSFPGLLAATVAGIVTSFSFMNGLLVWPLGLVYIYHSSPAGSRRNAGLAWWALAGIAATAAYMHGYHKPDVHPDLMQFMHNPAGFILFFTTMLGSMLGARSLVLSAVAGSAVAAVFLIFMYIHHKRKSLAGLMPMAMLGLFSMVSALSISVGRMGFGLKQAMPTKYTTITVFLVIADIVLVSSALQRGYLDGHQALKRGFVMASLTVLLAGAVSFYGYGIVWGHKQHDLRERASMQILNYPTAGDSELEAVYPSASYVREQAVFLEEKRLSLFN